MQFEKHASSTKVTETSPKVIKNTFIYSLKNNESDFGILADFVCVVELAKAALLYERIE